MARKPASIKTIRENVSHLRKMYERLSSMKVTAPPSDMKPVTVKRFGSRLIINGKTYKAGDLEAMRGKSANWQIPALAEVERMLKYEEAKLEKRLMTEKKKPMTKRVSLTDLESEQIRAGYDFITTEEEQEFQEWINEGSDGYKKKVFYHDYGADKINPGTIRGFLIYVGNIMGITINTIEELKNVWGGM